MKKSINAQRISEIFGMPIRTVYRYRDAEIGSWRKKVYFLLLEELVRIEKRKENNESKN